MSYGVSLLLFFYYLVKAYLIDSEKISSAIIELTALVLFVRERGLHIKFLFGGLFVQSSSEQGGKRSIPAAQAPHALDSRDP